MFVMTVDQHASRRFADQVPAALALLDGDADVRPLRAFVRTAGDEIQGILTEPSQVIRAASLLLRQGAWSVGIGVGAVETPLPPEANAGRGPAFLAARSAVDAAKRIHPPVVLCGDPEKATPVVAEADALLRLLAVIWCRRSPQGWEAVTAMARAATQKETASELKISGAALSQRLRAAAFQSEVDVFPLLCRLLSEADETI